MSLSPTRSFPVSFGIVVPAYNEERDIGQVLRALSELDPAPKEVIAVDDGSRDRTAEIIASWVRSTSHFRMLRHDVNKGQSAARNTAVREATADVVIFLDADDFPERDLLAKLQVAYATGADCVSLNSRVEGSTLFERYSGADHAVRFGDSRGHWTAGFSCRIELARRHPFREELNGSGEDVDFFHQLIEARATYVHEASIFITRIVPHAFLPFLKQARGRGRGVPRFDLHVRGLSLPRVLLRRVVAWIRDVALALLVVPVLVAGTRRARLSERPARYAVPFAALLAAQRAAQRLGELETTYAAVRAKAA
jgi:glycosyltransferase involved in cell wall biosynthesis